MCIFWTDTKTSFFCVLDIFIDYPDNTQCKTCLKINILVNKYSENISINEKWHTYTYNIHKFVVFSFLQSFQNRKKKNYYW
ncbi:hypothetical protein GDO81_002434 [Engystomops pustulosus]|uniref:Uncharacterized protein n=1 Tax=Engystomops pustulosus TaxID=76066 RepID=A0AAV7DNW4_ENGPU|nr:hypothetical protein GDO81_002434 [Engystomops pustulosus]